VQEPGPTTSMIPPVDGDRGSRIRVATTTAGWFRPARCRSGSARLRACIPTRSRGAHVMQTKMNSAGDGAAPISRTGQTRPTAISTPSTAPPAGQDLLDGSLAEGARPRAGAPGDRRPPREHVTDGGAENDPDAASLERTHSNTGMIRYLGNEIPDATRRHDKSSTSTTTPAYSRHVAHTRPCPLRPHSRPTMTRNVLRSVLPTKTRNLVEKSLGLVLISVFASASSDTRIWRAWPAFASRGGQADPDLDARVTDNLATLITSRRPAFRGSLVAADQLVGSSA